MRPFRLAAPAVRRHASRLVLLGLFLLTTLPGSTSPAFAQTGLQFNGSTQRVTFGSSATLNVSSFTIECWFKRLGNGAATSTGTGGWANVIPLVTKGRGEAETPANLNMNYFLGIRSDSVLVADFEEATGPNHPIGGTRVIPAGLWHHAAVTYDVATGRYRLYLNGAIEKDTTLTPGLAPASTSIQHAGLATAMTSTGATQGFFNGVLDEVRIWNVARTPAQVQADRGTELTAGAGLIARWGLNDGSGATAANSIAGSAAGTLVNAPAWVTGSPFANEYALRFLGAGGVAAFGNPAALGLSQFTIECWFRRDGAGAGTNSGTGGAITIPLLAHGRGDTDVGDVHVNWLLGLRTTDGVLMADLEESSAGTHPSQNHPVYGITPVAAGSGWHHGAATYDGVEWRLYLDGNLEATVAVGEPAGTPTVMPVSIGSALDAAGVADGFFDGAIDEARVWSVARDQAAIQADLNQRLATPVAGLVGRWGMDEGAGNVIASTAGTPLDGTLSASGWLWTGGAPFDLVIVPPSPPADPTGLVATAPSAIRVHLVWIDGSNNEAEFQVERSTGGGPFSPVATVARNVTTWDDTLATPATAFCYRVRAANVHGTSGYTASACTTTPEVTRTALDLSGGTYVTFGDADAIDLPAFTIECWFRRDGAGTTTTTGTGGVTDAIPLVTDGRGENEASNVDLNWFLGLRAADGVLAADFEEGAAGANPSLNHPITGVTPIPANGTWHHAAATYDGATWNLYLDGNLEATLAVNQPVASASTQHAAIGSALTSAGVAAGAFDGAFDEVRVWNRARTLTEIRSTANGQIDDATPGLVARWSLDEATGTAVGGSAGTSVNGTIVGTGYAWVAPAPFDLAFNAPPAMPVLVSPAHQGTEVPAVTPLRVAASDPDGGTVTVNFYGRATGGGSPAGDFTIVPIPDTQYYTGQLNGGSNAMLKSQLDWVVANRVARNIAYVVELGDCVEHGDNGGDPIEWMRADTSWARIENPATTGLTDGIPYGICVGNHDQSPNGDPAGTTTFYNQYFGIPRFQGRAYYGGPYRTNNDNWFDLFSVNGYDFVCIGLEYDTSPDVAVLDWADSLLKAYPNRRGILASHALLNTGNPGTWQAQGQATYDALKDNPNLDLMICGHVPGEGRRVETFNGHTTHVLLSDYQSRANGGSGFLRILEFSPANGVIRVRTYSPWLDQYEADADSSSQFTLTYDLGAAPSAFTWIGSVQVPSGEVATMPWPGLAGETTHEWYVTVSDGSLTRTGPVWSFTTAETVAPSVAVLAPNGGEVVAVGQDLPIAWNASDNVGVVAVDLLLSRSGPGGPWETLASGIPNAGTAHWTVTAPASAEAFVRVVAHDAATNVGEDVGDAAFTISSSVAVDDHPVTRLSLGSPVPNPSHGVTRFEFALPEPARVRLAVFDLQGREVAVLAHGKFGAGRHAVSWNARAFDGLYFVRLEVPGHDAFVRRVAILR